MKNGFPVKESMKYCSRFPFKIRNIKRFVWYRKLKFYGLKIMGYNNTGQLKS